jgi:hypothetical protein
MSRTAAAKVAANARRWWRNSAMAINFALPSNYFEGLGVPRLASCPQLDEPPGADPHAGVVWEGKPS